MKTTSKVMEIYLAGLARLENAPDYHYLDSKKRSKTHSSIPVRGVKEASINQKAKRDLGVEESFLLKME
jgi:hypothetical protein